VVTIGGKYIWAGHALDGCGCEMRGARGVERRLHLPTALGVVDLPPSVREELDGVDGSMPPSRHVGSNHDPCRSLNRLGGFAGGVIAVAVPKS